MSVNWDMTNGRSLLPKNYNFNLTLTGISFLMAVSPSVHVRWMAHLATAATQTPLGRHGNTEQDRIKSKWELVSAAGRLTRSSLPCCKVPREACSTRHGSVRYQGGFIRKCNFSKCRYIIITNHKQ